MASASLNGKGGMKETTSKPTGNGTGPQPAVKTHGKRTGDARDAGRPIPVQRHFTSPGRHPYDQIRWEKRTAAITDDTGKVIFQQTDVEVPASWSAVATNVVVSKYFRGAIDTPDRERSVRQMIDRVAKTLVRWGTGQGYFAGAGDADVFEAELTHILVNQIACFNSPVWFNVGIVDHPQCSACFIQSIEDSMESIMEVAKAEALLFKWGSGTGTNRSPLRSSKERIAGGGHASGPVSFMRGYDAFAGVIKSGGKTRRAAKMEILDADHPDIMEFIHAKPNEEKKAWALIDAGYDGSFTGEAYGSVFFQNSNLSVRATDDFMRAVIEDREYQTVARTTRQPVENLKAREVLKAIAEGTWICGDPGMQYDTTINDWHTCPESGRINASNPCSEYMFLDDTACNLASINLMKFRRDDGGFDVEGFRHVCRVMILAQEIIVDNASYPTAKIDRNSHDYRPLGLGYANLGALLMSKGLPYDSDQGRSVAAAVTAVMCGEAYRMSALIAGWVGPFKGFARNREPMLRVIGKHRDAAYRIDGRFVDRELLDAAKRTWDDALHLGREYGYANSQVTVLAPTGTIGFMMDCDTTGVEPDIALVKYKKMVGGGLMKLVNRTVELALRTLGYSDGEIGSILESVDKEETIEGAPGLREEHLSVFDCAFKPLNGRRSIHHMGHVKMMAAVQPFLSGAISKTVNVPNDATVEDISKVYIEAWRLGVKAIAIYRDGSKRTQPLNTNKKQAISKGKVDAAVAEALAAAAPEWKPVRRKLSDERMSVTHKFSVGGHEGYITVGLYEDGKPGEIFVKMSKEGTVVSGLMDTLATATSIALQYGVPLEVLVNKFSHVRFEPSGMTNNRDIPMAKSIIDYIFRWLGRKFLPGESAPAANTPVAAEPAAPAPAALPEPKPVADAKPADKPEPKPDDDVVPAPIKARLNGHGFHAPADNGHGSEALVAAAAPGDDDAADRRQAKVRAREKVVFQNQADAPTCPTCGDIMVRNGSCYRCHSCGGSSGCS
jgi:ribonucleoside-diphosphate reductase alpha chain